MFEGYRREDDTTLLCEQIAEDLDTAKDWAKYIKYLANVDNYSDPNLQSRQDYIFMQTHNISNVNKVTGLFEISIKIKEITI